MRRRGRLTKELASWNPVEPSGKVSALGAETLTIAKTVQAESSRHIQIVA